MKIWTVNKFASFLASLVLQCTQYAMAINTSQRLIIFDSLIYMFWHHPTVFAGTGSNQLPAQDQFVTAWSKISCILLLLQKTYCLICFLLVTHT